MRTDKKVPKLRFKGFTDDWEQRKLGEIVTKLSKKEKSTEFLPSIEYEDVEPEDGILNKAIQNKSDKKVGIYFDEKTVLFGKLRPYLRNWLNPSFKGVAVGDWWVLAPNNLLNVNFLYWLIQTKYFMDTANQTTGTKMPRSDWSLVSNTEFFIPTSKKEQIDISKALTNLQYLITLHQRKLDAVKKLKKAMLQKMFPGKGQKQPEIRFSGFTDDWEQRKLGEIADYLKGNGYSKNDLTEIGTPVILYGRLYTEYQFVINEVDTFANPKDNSVYSKGNEVIVPASGETPEDIARASAVEKSGILLAGDLNILRPFNFINPLFLALIISNGESQKELAKRAQGKSVVHIHNSDIQKVSTSFPTREEQDQIVAVFRNFDTLITLHQRKLEKLKNLKKSMLEMMFV